MGAQAQPQKIESSLGSKFTMYKQPSGVVIDDDPHYVLEHITDWIRAKYSPDLVPDWQIYRKAEAKNEINSWISNADFVLLDNRINNKFKGFQNGFDIALYIHKLDPDMQIFFYTGYELDIKSYGKQFDEFLAKPNVEFYQKSDFVPERRLDEFCNYIMIKLSIEQLKKDIEKQGLSKKFPLLGGKLVEEKQYSYHVIEFDLRKKSQNLQCLDDPWGNVIEVPTKHLKNIGISKNNKSLLLKILEFDGGQVLSFFEVFQSSEKKISKDIFKILEARLNEDNNI